MVVHYIKIIYKDHCRIGSLESMTASNPVKVTDHCRIGSLEIERLLEDALDTDHCRIGSLEKRI